MAPHSAKRIVGKVILGLVCLVAPVGNAGESVPGYEQKPGVAGSVNSAGTDTLNNLMAYWSEGFRALCPNVTVHVHKDNSVAGLSLPQAVALCRENFPAEKIAIAVECEEGLTAPMLPQLVVHALVNLLDNAVKYGRHGGRIDVAARRDGEGVRIAVSDQGAGIPVRHQSRVFERFYRIDGSSQREKGSGLGLAIARHIARSLGGDIRLESEVGVGSSFILYLARG